MANNHQPAGELRIMNPLFASPAALPPPISHSLNRVAQLLLPYGLRVQLIMGNGQAAPPDGDRPPASTDIAQMLTVGERRIATLVATGATNREVATLLFVSPKTVEAHLTHIYQKTGVRTRTELAYAVAAATRHVPDALQQPIP
jgi:DNA-binding NarL/FixJ family response regulator